jgi:hypothetical protein
MSQMPIGDPIVTDIAAPPPAFGPPAQPSPVTTDIDNLWNSDQGNQLLDTLDNLGEAYSQNGRVFWNPPADLDPNYVDFLSNSIDDLNRRIDAGELEIDANGSIRATNL